MKKGLVLLALIAVFAGKQNVHAGYLVTDLQSIITTIQNGYKTVEQLQASYENIKKNIEQLQETYKRFAEYDYSQLDPRNMNLPEDLKTAEGALGPVYKLMALGNSAMNVVNDMDNLLTSPSIKIGNVGFSIKDLFNPEVGPGAAGAEFKNFMVDETWGKKSMEEQAAWGVQFGMSQKNGLRYLTLKKKTEDLAMFSYAYNKALEENMKKQKEELNKATLEGAKASQDSLVKTGQISIAQVQAKLDALNENLSLHSKILDLESTQYKLEQAQLEANREIQAESNYGMVETWQRTQHNEFNKDFRAKYGIDKKYDKVKFVK